VPELVPEPDPPVPDPLPKPDPDPNPPVPPKLFSLLGSNVPLDPPELGAEVLPPAPPKF
jgi:hypothetical protein